MCSADRRKMFHTFLWYVITWILKFKLIFHIYCNKCCQSETVIETLIDSTVQKYLKLFILTDVHAHAVYFNKEKNSVSFSAFIILISKVVNLKCLYVHTDKCADGKCAISPCFIHS